MMMSIFEGAPEQNSALDVHARTMRLAVVGEFALGIAHDLNNVFTVVLANASVLGMQHSLTPHSGLSEELRDIISSARRGSEMVQRLVRFVRQEPTNAPLLPVDEAVDGLARHARMLLPANIKFEATIESIPFFIRADASAIVEIVLNLVTNARDAMPEGGEMQLKVTVAEYEFPPSDANQFSGRVGPYVTIAVTDNGCGLDDNVRARMFEPFFTTKNRIGDGTGAELGHGRERREGSGIGLAMTRALVRQLNGHIEVRTQPDCGTTIIVALPVERAND